jgi:hypothetical protein
MQSWRLRQPSRQIEENLFGDEARPVRSAQRNPHAIPWWQTLGATAAASVALLLTLVNFSGAGSASGSVRGGHLSLSNQGVAVSLAMASAPINTWASAPILHWTNEGTAGSSIRSFELLNTNHLLH